MKNQYFQQKAADKDDLLLQHAVAQDWVPKGCLLGGWIVHDLKKAIEDPCSGCRGPREKCGGRPASERVCAELDEKLRAKSTVNLRLSGNSEAEARKMVRRQWIDRMISNSG